MPRVRLDLSVNVMDRALWMASWIKGESGTVKTLISSICVLLSHSSTVQGISQGACRTPSRTQDQQKQMFLQKSRVKYFFSSSLNNPFL